MVFNWFRRQYSDRPDESNNPPAPTAPAESTTETKESTPTEAAESEPLAEDYLSWAKAAYKNIQQQKLETEIAEVADSAKPEPVEPENAEVVLTVEEAIAITEIAEPAAAISSPEITVSLTEVAEIEEAIAVTQPNVGVAEIEEPVAPEITEPVTEPEITATENLENWTLETATEPTQLNPQVEEIAPAETPEIKSETFTPPLTIAAESPIETPILTAENLQPETNIAEPLPFWARAQAEREARIERLKETAMVDTEAAIPTTQTSTLSPDQETINDEFPIAFDEGFLWSSEILASQGRRPDQVSFEEISWLQKLRKGLERTRRSLINQLKAIVGQGPLNQDAVMEIESLLLQADVGVEATDIIVNALQQKLREEVLPPEEAIAYLKKLLRDLLDSPCQEKASGNPAYSLTFAPEKDTLNIWLIVGVNGAGKTTTIGKISHLAQKSDYRTLIAAADTFRAAAVEQVKVWGSRSNVEVIANPGKNTDPAAVVFDAIAAAQSRNTELLIVDTAGRLQNKKNLMDELSKIRRIIDKKAPGAIVESLLVLDATLGQNGLRQAEVFSQAAQLSGVVLTKLDGTAKGGVALAIVQQLGLPIRFIGVGESIEDLRPFSSYEFVEALLSS
jgi:fused signal recognition particle receptor